MLMRNYIEKGFSVLIKFLALVSVAILVLILIFIFKESIGLFNRVSLYSFLFGTEWQPLGINPQVSIKPFIAATMIVSVIAIAIAIPIGVGFAMVISVLLPVKLARILKVSVNILAGIPSVVYGFIGLSVLVKFFEKYFSFSTGESVLVAGILLSIMILPYVVSSCTETITKINKKYSVHSYALVESKFYMMNNLILPACTRSIIASAILATGRAMGETMAVMMVIGNSPLMPKF
ncbi:MAG: phosphate ABC transporter permease subunit PstC [Clostridium sp.]|uniref:phosphate ABC transporter permease subunit PstC n=1 Tax=Clostridium sp. TaxID=1506 RepID=UPI003D6CEB48